MRGPLLIGIDGGGTHCRARVADSVGAVLGEATHKASANIATQAPAEAMQAILAASRAAARDAGVGDGGLAGGYAGLGLAGAAIETARAALVGLLEAGHFRKAEIRTDAYATWLGSSGGGDGAILILGTGSCGLAVVDGVEHYVGGGGPAVSDEASAQWIGREAVRRTLWACDGRAVATPLTKAVLARLGGNVDAMVGIAAQADAARLGEIAPLVFDHADRRDALGLKIVSEAAADAARMITRLLDVGAPAIYLHGGLAGRLADWLPPPLRKHLATRRDDPNVPLEGAVLLARRCMERHAPAAVSASL